jgi:archaeal flagellin FlaB
MLKKVLNHERGITGLETAIILIAFVVVAAVFAYTVLSAGLFSTQKSQEAVYSGLKEAQSTLEIRGGVIAPASVTGSSGTISQLKFTVGIVLGGQAIDFTEPLDADDNGIADADSGNVVVITYQDDNQVLDDLYWTIAKLGNTDSDQLLEENERFEITIGGAGGVGDLVDALTTDLSVKTKFNIEIITPGGATLNIERTTPAWIDTIVNLR